MICPFCNSQVDFGDTCHVCGASIRPYRQILSLSDYYYNEGLNRAMVRDLSGAIENLKLSLKYNKFQIEARNLLGLVYFETQQLAAALSEWVLSVNFMPEGNIATRYLQEFEFKPTLLSDADKGVRKYNLALEYCRRGSRDLAVIQLKKVKDMMPRFVPAFQLLALLYIQDGKYEQARRLLKDASRVDTNNTTTLRYMKEVNESTSSTGKKRRKKESEQTTGENAGEVIVPRTFERITGLAGTMFNIVIGLVIGALAMMFLVMPGFRQQADLDADKKIAVMSQAISSRSQSVSALRNEIEKLEAEVTDFREKAEVADSNDLLIQAYLAYVGGDINKAGRILTTVNTSNLGSDGQALYDNVTAAVNSVYLQQLYDEGYGLFESADYEGAIPKFKEVVEVDKYFGEGGALYYLGQAYRHTDKLPEAKVYYAMLVKAFPETWFAQTAAKYVSDVEVEQADIDPWIDPNAVPEDEAAAEVAAQAAAQQAYNAAQAQSAIEAASRAAIEAAVAEALDNQPE